MTVTDVLTLFCRYLSKFQPYLTVVFDGYQSCASTKDEEHQRRSTTVSHVAPDRQIDINKTDIGPQEPFLANEKNKIALIALLMTYLPRHNIKVCQAEGDADVLVVSTASDILLSKFILLRLRLRLSKKSFYLAFT